MGTLTRDQVSIIIAKLLEGWSQEDKLAIFACLPYCANCGGDYHYSQCMDKEAP